MGFNVKRKTVEDEDDDIEKIESLDLNDDSDTSDEERDSEEEEDDEDEDEDEDDEELIYDDDDEELEFEDDEEEDDDGSEQEKEEDNPEKAANNKVVKAKTIKDVSKRSDKKDKHIIGKGKNKLAKEKPKNDAKSKKASTSNRVVAESGDASGDKEADKEEKRDEYEEDSSDEEDARNTIGNVPLEWYKDYDHIGYGLDGLKIMKEGKVEDELDNFISKMDDPNYWRTVRDRSTGKKIVLSDEDIKFIRKYLRGKYTEKSVNQTPDFDEPFVRDTMHHPLTNHPENKASYGPSKWEKLKIGQMVHSMKMGWMKVSDVTEKKDDDDEDDDDDEKVKNQFYALWTQQDDTELKRRIRQYIAAPKTALPGHAESYNPPPEYLFSPEEEQKWRDTEPSERRMNFIPQKFNSLRQVPSYSRFVSERFERCLDLYLCPRKLKMRANVKAEDLLPKLPSPRDLQPFPTVQALMYKGHSDAVRCLSFHPAGELFASGSEDHSIRIWEVSSGRCVRHIPVEGGVSDLKWNPKHCLIAAAVGNKVLIINTLIGTQVQNTDTFIGMNAETNTAEATENKVPVTWENVENNQYGIRVTINHPKPVSQLSWQGKGDYLAVVLKEGQSLSVLLHRLSSRVTMNPFNKPKGIVQCVSFHPNKPILFVATQQYIRVYHLAKQMLTKKLMANCKWVSSMAVHPWGDNVIVGSYDSKLSWFDTQLSDKPYQTLRHHKSAIRQVCFHKTLPLFASCSDDGSTIICHGKVYNDLTINPLIVPVKVLRGHIKTKSLGVMACQFHPVSPWIISAGADHSIRLYA